MKSLLVVFAVLGAALGNVDILVPEAGQVPVMSWTENSMPWVMYCQEPQQPVCLGNSCNNLSLSLHTESDSEVVLLAVSGTNGWNDSIVLKTVNLSDLLLSTYQELHADEFFPPVSCSFISLPILPRYALNDSDRDMFIVLNTGYTGDPVQNQTWMTTIPVDPWSSLMANPVDTTSWCPGFFTSQSILSEQVPQGNLPQFITVSGYSDGYPGPSTFGINTLYLESEILYENELYSIDGGYPDIDPEVLTTGYGQTDQIALWTDTAGCVWCSNFVSSPVNPVNSVLVIAHSEMPFAAAMTKTREDPGILLAWYDGASVMVRHWMGEWNSYSYPVEPWTHVSPGNIAVCSDTDGYWVAWKDDLEFIPQYRFIPRTSVTGIEETHCGLPGEGSLRISENPVSSGTVCYLSLPLDESYTLCLFDLNGRNLGQLASGGGGQFQGVLDLEEYPSGVYSLVLSTESTLQSIRILKTGD